MIDLYLIFFLVGGLLFAGIVWYSMRLQRGRSRPPKQDYVDPLFAELEDSKAKTESDSANARAEKKVAAEPRAEIKASNKSNKSGAPSRAKSAGEDKPQAPSLNDDPAPEKVELKATGKTSLPVIEESAPEKFNQPNREPSDRPVTSDTKSADLNDSKKAANAAPQENSQVAGSSAPESEQEASSEPENTRPKTRSFTQKLADKVAQRASGMRSSGRRASSKTRPERSVLSNDVSSASGNGSDGIAEEVGAAYRAKKEELAKSGADKPKLDEQSSSIVTELVARVKNPESIEQRELLSLFRNHDFKFHRKVHIYGLNQLTDIWQDVEFELPTARFVELGVSIQLADRDGAMSQKELHDFQQMALEFSNAFNAPFEFSMDIDEALKQAQLLDQIGRRYDSMAVLNVVPKSKSGFRMADIESCARDLMMSTDKNGIFMKTQGRKHDLSVLYRLACTDGSGHFGLSAGAVAPIHDLVVYMNVPATQDPESVFQQMVQDANSLGTWLEGKVVDRNGRAMTQRSYSMLMQQISDIAFSMQQDGLVPGDEISKKLF